MKRTTAHAPIRDNSDSTCFGGTPPGFSSPRVRGEVARSAKIGAYVGKGPPARILGDCLLGRARGQVRGEHARGPGAGASRVGPWCAGRRRRLHPAQAGSAGTERPSEASAVQGSSPSRRAGGTESTARMASAVTGPGSGADSALVVEGERSREASVFREAERASLRVGWARATISRGREPWGIEARAESYPEGCPGTEREPRKGSSPIFCELGDGPWSAGERVRVLRARALSRGWEELAGAACGGAGRRRAGRGRGASEDGEGGAVRLPSSTCPAESGGNSSESFFGQGENCRGASSETFA